MKLISLLLVFAVFLGTSCKRGSGHAATDEDAELFQSHKASQSEQETELRNQPIIPSPLDTEAAPTEDIDDIGILVKPNIQLPQTTANEQESQPAPPAPITPEESIPRALPALPDTVPFPTLTNVYNQINIPAADYPNGTKRFAEVKQRLSHPLKKALSARGFQLGNPVFIRIIKNEKVVEVFLKKQNKQTFELLHSYNIAAMSGGLGPKKKQGDYQAPEGFYFVPSRQLNAASNFHLSFNLGYPNSYDQAHGYTGNFLMMHGSNVSIGCFAMTDPAIEEIYTLCEAALSSGSQSFFRVHSFPFRMTEHNMRQHQSHAAYPFWTNLKQGYDLFEQNRIPPNITVSNKKYIISHP